MMDEYISKKAVEDIFARARRAMKPEEYTGQEFFIRDNILLNAQQIIHSIQSADVRPVVRGKWKVTSIYIKCLECGECFMLIPQNFCPHCGADMRGGDAE